MCARRAFSHAWHASQESVVLSDTCFLFEVPLHLSNQHGKEGSQEGSSRSPSPQGDEGKEGIRRRSDCQRLKLLLCCLLGDTVQFSASVLRHTLAVFSRGLYKRRSVVMAGIDLKRCRVVLGQALADKSGRLPVFCLLLILPWAFHQVLFPQHGQIRPSQEFLARIV